VTGFRNQPTSFPLCFKADRTFAHCAFKAGDKTTANFCCTIVVGTVAVGVAIVFAVVDGVAAVDGVDVAVIFVVVVSDDGVLSLSFVVASLPPTLVRCCKSGEESDGLRLVNTFRCIFLGCGGVSSMDVAVALALLCFTVVRWW